VVGLSEGDLEARRKGGEKSVRVRVEEWENEGQEGKAELTPFLTR